jgi:hypothetical protein
MDNPSFQDSTVERREKVEHSLKKKRILSVHRFCFRMQPGSLTVRPLSSAACLDDQSSQAVARVHDKDVPRQQLSLIPYPSKLILMLITGPL